MTRFNFLYASLFAVVSLIKVNAQDVAQMIKSKPLSVKGGLSLSTIYRENLSQRDTILSPLNYYLAGNLNLSVFGYSVPLSLRYTNRKVKFSEPFNQLSLSPSYKNFTSQIGRTSVNYHRYTLSGHSINGLAVGFTQPKWSIQATRGELLPLQHADSTGRLSQFKRVGTAFRLGKSFQWVNLEHTLIFARDKVEEGISVANLTPKENLAASLKAEVSIKKSVRLQLDYAISLFTENRSLPFNDSLTDVGVSGVENLLKPWLNFNNSSALFTAKSGSLFWGTSKGHTYNLTVEQVDPGYKSMGVMAVNNDYVQTTVGYSGSFEKWNLSLNLGQQWNNLTGTEEQTTRRLVLSTDIGWSISDQTSTSVSYSNQNSFTNISPLQPADELMDELDSLRLFQINHSGSINFSHSYKKSKINYSGSISYQQGRELTNRYDTLIGSNKTENYNISNALSVPLSKTWSFSGALQGNHSIQDTIQNSTLGPVVSVNGSLLGGVMRIQSNLGYHKAVSIQQNSSVIRTAVSLSCSPKSKNGKRSSPHRISLQVQQVIGKNHQVTANTRYSYRF